MAEELRETHRPGLAGRGIAAERKIQHGVVVIGTGKERRRARRPIDALAPGEQQARRGGPLHHRRGGVAGEGDGALDDRHRRVRAAPGDDLRDDVRQVTAAADDERIRGQGGRHTLGVRFLGDAGRAVRTALGDRLAHHGVPIRQRRAGVRAGLLARIGQVGDRLLGGARARRLAQINAEVRARARSGTRLGGNGGHLRPRRRLDGAPVRPRAADGQQRGRGEQGGGEWVHGDDGFGGGLRARKGGSKVQL